MSLTEEQTRAARLAALGRVERSRAIWLRAYSALARELKGSATAKMLTGREERREKRAWDSYRRALMAHLEVIAARES